MPWHRARHSETQVREKPHAALASKRREYIGGRYDWMKDGEEGEEEEEGCIIRDCDAGYVVANLSWK